jgi:ribosome maturation factor RimP
LNEQQDGKVEFEGNLTKLDAAGIFINSDKGEELFIPFTKINRAKQVIK